DEHWHTVNGVLKRQALASLGLAKRNRAMRARAGQLVCATLLLIGGGWWMHAPAMKRDLAAQRMETPPSRAAQERFISEEAMVAMFPRGSCIVAEINGQKELVFFDAQKAAE